MMKLLLLLITALCLMLVAALILCLLLLTTMLLQIYWTLPQQSDANRYAETTYQWGKHLSMYVCTEHESTWLKLVMYLYSNWSCIDFSFGNEQGCTYTTICLYRRYTTILAIISAVPIPIQMFTAGCINLYTHAHHVPHAEQKVRNGEARSAVETTQCCPPSILFTDQQVK